MKKVFKIIGITLLIFVALLIAIPFAFQGQIKDMVKGFINESINAKVTFSDVSLSLIRSFPQAHVSVNDLVIKNLEPFKDETLASAQEISFTMDINELFKTASTDPIAINAIYINEALINIKTDKLGNSNYDITKETATNTTTNSETSSFAFSIEDYQIKNSAFSFIDEATNLAVQITELNHEGHGTFSAETSELNTNTEANITFAMDSTNYLSSNPVKLDAIIGLDLANSKYTFKNNKALINNLPLEFQGYVQLLENGQQMDMTFKSQGSDFKNFLAVIPKVYSKDIANVKTSGDFKIKGIVKGLNSDTTIPNLDVSIISKNAYFKYPNLPKAVENIAINTQIKNTTGNLDDTYVDIKTLNFKIDNDIFKSSILIKNITKNMLVNANFNGAINLANITKAYPVELDNNLTGILKAKLNTSFDMDAIETNAYQRIKNNGSASINDFVFTSADLANPFHITNANISFNPGTVTLDNFNAKTGTSDMEASGTINNLLGFLLSDNKLKGNFNVKSNLFKLSDFISESTTKTASTETTTTNNTESLKIPTFLDCTINANAKTVIYDNLKLENMTGTLFIKDQQAKLENLTSNIFNGTLSVSGNVSTKEKTPTFNLNLDAKNFDISESFKSLELLQNIAPIAKMIQGKINTTLNLTGALDNELSPVMNSLSGDALAELLDSQVKAKDGLLSKLEGSLNFIDFSKLNLKDLKTKLAFANGKVSVKPFDLKYNDIAVTVSGSHGFDQNMDYNAVFNVPAKYLGSEVNRLIGQINDTEVDNIAVPITANIGGNFANPNVKTNLTSGVTSLTKQLIEIKKQKLLDKGKDKVKNLIGNVISGNTTATGSVKQNQTNTVKNALGSLIKNNSTKDTTNTAPPETTKKVIKNVLGGLLGGKKKP